MAKMDSAALAPDDSNLDPPPRLYERLRQLAGYTWDESHLLSHSSYDFWHAIGSRFVSPFPTTSTSTSPPPHNVSSPGSMSRLQSGRPSPGEHPGTLSSTDSMSSSAMSVPQPQPQHQSSSQSQSPPFGFPLAPIDSALVEEAVVARISYHGFREERAFHIAKSLTTTTDPTGEHIVKPIEIVRLTSAPGDRGPVTVAIYQYPGHNYLWDVLDMGPAFYKAREIEDSYVVYHNPSFKLQPPISLQHFLDFAIGAAECLEILHHRQGIVHGEIRGDAFHFNVEKNKVKVASFGSGVRSFEHGLTSTGWSTLSKELGAKNKLLYISPEQTGRMPAEPDSRTDIYSLGVLCWMLLTQQPVFDGDSPLDIVQGVLGRKIPLVSDIRLDIPEAIGRILQKCTAKNTAERYHSVGGLRHDLVQAQDFLARGDWEGLKEWEIGAKDVSSIFILPNSMIGRQRERADLLKVIDRVAKSHAMQAKGTSSRFSDGSSFSNDMGPLDDVSSEGASSVDGTNRRSGSFTQAISSDLKHQRSSIHQSVLSDLQTASGDTMSSTQSIVPRIARPWERHHSISIETRSLADSTGTEGNRHSMAESMPTSLSKQLGSAKFRRRGHCEVVLIEGAGGLGKSCLVQSVLADVRRRGYCATAKFDTARKTSFGPLLKLLSSLFKQVWGERNTETPFHQGLKQYIRPVWPMLHKVLALPEFLLGPPELNAIRSISLSHSPVASTNGRSHNRRRGSSPSSSPGPLMRNPSVNSQSSQDFLRAGAATKTMRLMNTFLDVLRVFTSHKLICFCLDDLHYADDESLELISQIIGARMKMAIVITYRPEELSPDKVQSILHPQDSDDFTRVGGPTITKITLTPLSEEDIVQYVSTTMCRPKDEILSLALVIQAKTAGNPFYIREMLSACHRKRCVWYDYRDSVWHYDLDRLFEQFQGEKDYDVLDTGFITRRLNELPDTARTILAWAALLGNTFSFELISRLMTGEFEFEDDGVGGCMDTRSSYSQHEAIAGLQAALQAYIIVSTEVDDRFRFAHDRYIQAASALKECKAHRMHFIIAQTLIKYYSSDFKLKDSTAFHICGAVDIVKRRVSQRRHYRKLLMECAQSSTENGARSTAAKYYDTAIKLLQDNPWVEGADDVSHEETVQLHLRAAECYLFMGHYNACQELLSIIFRKAVSALDKAPAFVLQSRVFSQNGNSQAAVVALKECLGLLGVSLDENPTYEKCDEMFEKLSIQIQTMDRTAIVSIDQRLDPTLASIGAVLSESVSAAWWSDGLRFYHLALVLIKTHLDRGGFPQSGIAFLQMSVIALGRFNMTEFAVELGGISQDLLQRSHDSFSMARGLMLYPCLIGHTYNSMALSLSQMEDAVEQASSGGDRLSTILSYGFQAQMKFFASESCIDLEAFCQYGCEEIPNWYLDTRGGAIILAMRQLSRALQGKTNVMSPVGVMTDDTHNAISYKNWLANQPEHGNRALILYEGLEIIPLFLYGHYEKAVEVAKHCFDNLKVLWSLRNSRLIILFYGLALSGKILRKTQDPRTQLEDHTNELEEVAQTVRGLTKMVQDWASVSNINYLSWIKLLEAQVAELTKDHGAAIQAYEAALDHAAEYDFVLEEALGNFLMAGFFLRRKARRSARAALLEAVRSFRQITANGVAAAIEEEHSLLLYGPTRSHRTADVAIQTDFVADSSAPHFRPVDAEVGETLAQINSNTMTEHKGERIGAWRGSMNMQAAAGAGLPALDMIDLHAILVSSQVISSVLQIEELLKTMCDVILQTCGGSATLAAIVIQEDGDDQSWVVAASGDPEKGASAHRPGIPLSGTSLIAENVVLYCTRFLESVFTSDLVSDERFGNVADQWLQRNPMGKSIIAIPISHGTKPLLGVLYLEGEPGSFTDRNVTVLQLLVNQIGISYSNAVAMKNVEKISAENRSMVAIQKRALAKALEAETKAKDAEAEAKRNVKLAEEAAKAKSIFLANVSHELRTPLNGVIGNSELLRDSSLNRDQLEMADSIRVSADLLLTVINDILDFSKMEADKMKLYIIAFNPEEMVREVVRAVSYSNREKTSKKNVKIIQDINLPPMLIYGDPIRLHQVLGNLIGNSLKFTEDGSITIGARLDEDSQESATLTFWVRDTGIGIPPQQLAKLFQPFSQADASTARKYGGSGLGLSICKSLIEIMMNGKIQLESEETVGTTAWFTVTFEKAKSDVSAGEAQAKSSPTTERNSAQTMLLDRSAFASQFLDLSQIRKEDVRICVAEDNPINQKIAIQYVQRLGYVNVTAYENGLKAVEGLRKMASEGKPYHIVLMDVQMPVLDGYEATKLIRKDSIEAVRKILVIAMTASAIQGDREKCLAAGMNDYLAKPVRSEVLKKKLDTYLSSPQQPPGLAGPDSRQVKSSAPPNSSRVIEQVPPAPPPKSPRHLAVSDPMQDQAVFNQPLDHTSYQAKDSPTFELQQPDSSAPPQVSRDNATQSIASTSRAPSRASSDNRSSDIGDPLVETQSQQQQKRRPRKLTKSRGNSDVTIDPATTTMRNRASAESPAAAEKSAIVVEKITERTRGVLTKRGSQNKSGTNLAEQGQGLENTPFAAGEDTTANINNNNNNNGSGSNRGMPPSQADATSLRDSVFPN